jgi:toxin ParE1/3/4
MTYLPEYYDDIDEAMAWYDRKQRGLGIEFLDELERTLNRIRKSPDLFSLLDRRIRVAKLARFPYGVYFRSDSPELLVIGVLHLHRSTRTWKRRI